MSTHDPASPHPSPRYAPPPTGMPHAHFPGATASQPLGMVVTVPLDGEVVTDEEVRRQRRKSKAAAFGVAALAHAVIVLLALLIIVAEYVEEVPEITVAGEGDQLVEQPEKKTFAERVTRSPSESSSSPLPTIVSDTSAAIAIPEVDHMVDDPIDLGTMGIGEGLGFGRGLGVGGANFLGLAGGGKRIVLVIDTSSSMPGACGPEGIAAIRREIEKTVNALAPSTEFNLVCYANDADLFKEEPVAATAGHKKEALKFMEGYFGDGPWLRTRTEKYGKKGTDAEGIDYHPVMPDDVSGLDGTSGGSRIELGLIIALEMKPSSIFILSDGNPVTQRNGEPLAPDELIKLAVKAHKRIGGEVTLGTVSINGQGEEFLKEVARAFKGKHKDIDPKKI